MCNITLVYKDKKKTTTIDNITFKDIMTFLCSFKTTVEKSMESMENKIVTSKESMEQKIKAMNMKIDGRLDALDIEVKRMNDKVDTVDVNNDKAFMRMDSRLLALEKEMAISSKLRRRSEELREREKLLRDQPDGRFQPWTSGQRCENDVNGNQREENFQWDGKLGKLKSEKQKETNPGQPTASLCSSWAQEMELELQRTAKEAG